MGNWDWQVFLQDPGGKIPTYWQWLVSAWGWTVSVSLCSLFVALVLGSRGTLKTLTLTAIPIDDYIDSVLKSGT